MIEQEEFLKDKRFPLVRTVFMDRLHQRKDVKISSEDAEETFLALWIFLNKKMTEVYTGNKECFDGKDAENFYKLYVERKSMTREYLDKLLKSFRIKSPPTEQEQNQFSSSISSSSFRFHKISN